MFTQTVTGVITGRPVAPPMASGGIDRTSGLTRHLNGGAYGTMKTLNIGAEPKAKVTDATTLSDQALIRAVAQQDKRAFEALYYRFAPRIGRFLHKMLRREDMIDEVVNDVMVVVWQSAGRFDPLSSSLSTWLFGIAHNKALKHLARARRHANEVPLDMPADDGDDIGLEENPQYVADQRTPEYTLMGRQIGAALEEAMNALSPEHRAVIELAFAEDFSYQEIAGIVDCPVNTVKTRVFHARKRLSQLLAERGVAPSAQLAE